MFRANKIVILLILFSFINIQNLSLFLTFDFHCISILFSSRFSLLQPFSLHRWTVSIRVMVTQMEKRLSRSTLIDSYTVCRSFLLFHCLPPYWPGNDEIILRVSATPPQRIENRRRKIFFLREIGWLSGSPRWFSMAKGSHFFGEILLHFFLSFPR